LNKEKLVLTVAVCALISASSGAGGQEAADGRGKKILEDKCLLCHEADVTEQQRLSRQGWTREVEKMIRWGAAVSDAEKEPLIDYLSSNFGPRPLAVARK